MISKILVPTDGSKTAMRGVRDLIFIIDKGETDHTG